MSRGYDGKTSPLQDSISDKISHPEKVERLLSTQQ
jgi:hypothetical protein